VKLRIYLKDGSVITVHPSSVDSVYVDGRPLTELLGTDAIERIEVEVE